jgi:hypothetical protein
MLGWAIYAAGWTLRWAQLAAGIKGLL